MNTGVVTVPSLDRLERASAQGFTDAAFARRTPRDVTAASDGSRRASGIELERPATSPDFTSPCGMSAE